MPWFLPIVYVVLDIVFGRVGTWNATQWGYYVLSLAASLALWFVWWRTTRALRPRHPRIAVVLATIVGTVYGVNLVLVYGYVAFLGAMPNYYTFEFLLDEPLNSWIMLRDSLTLTHLVLFVPAAAFFARWLYGPRRRARRRPSRLVRARWPVWTRTCWCGREPTTTSIAPSHRRQLAVDIVERQPASRPRFAP